MIVPDEVVVTCALVDRVDRGCVRGLRRSLIKVGGTSSDPHFPSVVTLLRFSVVLLPGGETLW